MTRVATTMLDPLPPVRRVGYDHGWHMLGPTFLNLRMPMLIVDRVFLDATDYGLEHFGTRDPHSPLPRIPLIIERSGRFVALYDARAQQTEPVAVGAFANLTLLKWLTDTDKVVTAIGNTRAMELSWAALWDFSVGIASGPAVGRAPAAAA